MREENDGHGAQAVLAAGYSGGMSRAAANQGRPATTADLLALPDRPRHELIAGNLVQKLLPSPRHGFMQSDIVFELGGPFQRGRGGPGGWWFGVEIACELTGTDTFLPDVAGWRVERLPGPPDGPICRVRPDWVCEILSSSNPTRDLRDKLRGYHRGRVPHYWIVDPHRRSVTAYRWADAGYLVVDHVDLGPAVVLEPFDAVPLDLSGVVRVSDPAEARTSDG